MLSGFSFSMELFQHFNGEGLNVYSVCDVLSVMMVAGLEFTRLPHALFLQGNGRPVCLHNQTHGFCPITIGPEPMTITFYIRILRHLYFLPPFIIVINLSKQKPGILRSGAGLRMELNGENIFTCILKAFICPVIDIDESRRRHFGSSLSISTT